METALNLTSADLAKLAPCGITAELAQRAQLRRVDSREGGEIIGRNGSGDYAGIVFPNVAPGQDRPREYRLRRDHPDIEYEDGKPKQRNKYLSPPGRGNLLYFVPGTAAEWLQDPALPIVFTEGEKKALALWACAWDGLGDAAEAPRILPVAAPGVWAFRGSIGKTEAADGHRQDVKGLIPDVHKIVWKGRKVLILFDTNVRENSSVQAARSELTRHLQKLGAIVSWFVWPDDTPGAANGIDDLVGMWGVDRVRHLLVNRSRPAKLTAADREATREFTQVGEDHYRLTVPNLGITFDVDRMRREHHELIAELSVSCELPGARTVVDNIVSIADMNLSSARARQDRAKLLADRSNTTGSKDLDWVGLVEELCQRSLQADRAGQPAVDLRTLSKPDREADTLDVDGLRVPRRHPSIVFGDGGALKSYLGLYFIARLAQRGMRVALFDWELSGEDHRERLERLFGNAMPRIHYARCERPLHFEVDRLRRIVRDNEIDFALYDSVAFACDGPPEAAEVAGRYLRGVRQIGCGGMHIAHISKGENADQKPFGSIFWHNGFRSTWFAQRADDTPDGDVVRIGLFNRKSNLDRLMPPMSFSVAFTRDGTVFHRADVADNPELAVRLSIKQRMQYLLKKGAMNYEAIAEELDAKPETVERVVRRNKSLFRVIEGGLVGLASSRAS